MSRIERCRVTDTKMGKFLFEAYKEIISQNEVTGTYFEFDPDCDCKLLLFMKDFGFKISRADTDMLRITLADAKALLLSEKTGPQPMIKFLEELSTYEFVKGVRDCAGYMDRKPLWLYAK